MMDEIGERSWSSAFELLCRPSLVVSKGASSKAADAYLDDMLLILSRLERW